MAYLSLYRKHRPRTFAEVVGQEHVTRTLVNAITEDRLHHAYLFTGQRGTGKTSTARILAAAVNCENGPTPTPCGECEQCVSIVAGRNVDVVELDMASNGGVDDARDLRDRAVFAPAAARRKVYILDEVHMASTAAFNALLKVVEEPPPHVLFAMATTDPQKVLPTIMSRVQRLDLRRVAAPDLTAHLRHLGEIEGFTLDDEAAAAVVAAGDGSVRDTLSVLEQVLAFASDAEARVDGVLPVTGGHVTRVLGATPLDLVLAVVDAIADADVAGALTGVQRLLDGGHDLRRFTLDLARHLRDLLVLRAAPDVEGLVEAAAERRVKLLAQSQRFGTDTLLRAVELIGDVLVEQRQGPPRLPLELAVARLATPGADGDLTALADRVARLEQVVDGGRPLAAPSAPAAVVQQAVAVAAPVAAPVTAPTPSEGVVELPEDAPAVEDVETVEDDPSPVTDEVVEPAVAEVEPAAEPATMTDEGAAARAAAAEAAAAAVAAAPAPAAPVADAPEEETAEAEDLPSRAAAIAQEAGPLAPAADLANRPGTTTVERELPPERPGADDLAKVVASWEAILTIVADASRRAKAFYEPATPVRLGGGVLLLRYPAARRFHAEQGKSGEMAQHLTDAITQSTGLEHIRIDVQIDDEDVRRPTPPPVGSAAPVVDDGPTEDEVVAVAEVEVAGGTAAVVDPAALDEMLRVELDAERLPEDD